LTQIKVRPVRNYDNRVGFYGDGFAPLPQGSLLGLGVRIAHPFFSSNARFGPYITGKENRPIQP
jgi:hypothetical protein